MNATTPTTCPYLVGVAEVDVTPAIGTKLAGFAARTGDATGVYLPLRSIVTAITDRATDQTVIIVVVEWLGFYDNTDHARALINAATGVPTDDILLSGTHTHCGPPMRKHVDADCRRHRCAIFAGFVCENCRDRPACDGWPDADGDGEHDRLVRTGSFPAQTRWPGWGDMESNLGSAA